MFNVAVNPQLTPVIENKMCTNPTPPMEEDATSGKTYISKNIMNNEFGWKICNLDICQKWKVAE